MGILKDLISISIFVISLFVLYKTTDHIVALVTIIAVTIIFLIKHVRLNKYLKKEAQAAKISAFEKDEQLKCMLENMPILAFLKDTENNFIIGSSSFEEAINCPRGELSTYLMLWMKNPSNMHTKRMKKFFVHKNLLWLRGILHM